MAEREKARRRSYVRRSKSNARYELGTSRSLRMQVARKKCSRYPDQGSIGAAYLLDGKDLEERTGSRMLLWPTLGHVPLQPAIEIENLLLVNGRVRELDGTSCLIHTIGACCALLMAHDSSEPGRLTSVRIRVTTSSESPPVLIERVFRYTNGSNYSESSFHRQHRSRVVGIDTIPT